MPMTFVKKKEKKKRENCCASGDLNAGGEWWACCFALMHKSDTRARVQCACRRLGVERKEAKATTKARTNNHHNTNEPNHGRATYQRPGRPVLELCPTTYETQPLRGMQASCNARNARS